MLPLQRSPGLNLNRNCTLPHHSGWRQYKLRFADDSFFKIPIRITTPDELKYFLNKLNPTDVYVTTSCWLNPELLGPKRIFKAGYKHLSVMLLHSDFFIDLDSKPFMGNIEETYREMLKIHDYLSATYENFTFARTGKGFHIYCHDWYEHLPKKPALPYDRIEYVKQQKKKLLYELLSKGFRIADHLPSINVFQIARVWGSVHNNGTVIECAKNPFTKALINPRRLVE